MAIFNTVYGGEGRFLPKTYQEVEWIESSVGGNQMINTGYTANSNIRITTKFRTTGCISDGNSIIFGTTYGSRAFAAPLAFYFNKKSTYQFGASGGSSDYSGYSYNQDYELDYTLSSITFDGVTKTKSLSTGSYDITLFYGNGKGGGTRIYSFKIYTGATLERDFVPCYRKSDGVIGMYDLVGKQFYANAGSGTFTKGSDV